VPDLTDVQGAARLLVAERLVAGLAGAGLLGVALVLVVAPQQRSVALSQCPDAAAGCIVSVDSDLTALSAVLAAGAAAAISLASLGIRFKQAASRPRHMALSWRCARSRSTTEPGSSPATTATSAGTACCHPDQDGSVLAASPSPGTRLEELARRTPAQEPVIWLTGRGAGASCRMEVWLRAAGGSRLPAPVRRSHRRGVRSGRSRVRGTDAAAASGMAASRGICRLPCRSSR
jgi:hypothetical protein